MKATKIILIGLLAAITLPLAAQTNGGDMMRTERAENLKKQMGLDESQFSKSFSEYEKVKDSLVYGEILVNSKLPEEIRYLVQTACLTTVESLELENFLNSALKNGIKAEALQEVFFQISPYIGFSKAEKGLAAFEKACKKNKIKLPLSNAGTVTEENRLEKGIAAQKSLFGPFIDQMRSSAPQNQKALQDYLSAWCFGDTYTRGVLELKTRELLTFVSIICLGGCDSQANSHATGNFIAGNNSDTLIEAVVLCLPYIGFPRTLNAVSAITASEKAMQEKMGATK